MPAEQRSREHLRIARLLEASLPAEKTDDQVFTLVRHFNGGLELVDAPDEVVLNRLSGRRQCSNGHLYHVDFDPPKREGVCDQDGKPLFRRKDDEPETVQKRLATYHKQTEPLKDYYDERGFLRRFDGTRDKAEVHDHIRATLATLRLEERL